MNVTQLKWVRGQCRVESGIFFADDSVILLSGNPRDGYVASHRRGLASLVEDDPDGWSDLNENPACRVEAGGVIATAGATSWEGEGFVAALRAPDSELLWVLHLSESEAFSEVSHDGDIIRAVSSEYPNEYRWLIPVNKPERLRVVASRAG